MYCIIACLWDDHKWNQQCAVPQRSTLMKRDHTTSEKEYDHVDNLFKQTL